MVITRKASREEFQAIAAFYRENNYRSVIGRPDLIVLTEMDGRICGAVRLCKEYGTLVLRGMRVREDLQRQGIGTRLLRSAEVMIGKRVCYCVSHRHLRDFYGQIGFKEIQTSRAPRFLTDRCSSYREKLSLDVIIMRRC